VSREGCEQRRLGAERAVSREGWEEKIVSTEGCEQGGL
jgi:hypothetical protein